MLFGALAVLASPIAAQFVTSMPFGQRNTVLTPLPFGQRNASPMRPVGRKTATAATNATMVGNIVAQWNMTETSGTTMFDSSGNGNNGTTKNVVMTGAGYQFDGTSSKVVVPNSASLTPGGADFSFSVTFQTSSIPLQGTDYDLIRKGLGSGSGGEFKLEIVYDRGIGKPKCVVADNLGHTASKRGAMNVADGQTHTVTCTRTGTTLTQQVDSLAPTTATASITGPITTIKPLTIGVKAATATGATADWFPGTLFSASMSVVPATSN